MANDENDKFDIKSQLADTMKKVILTGVGTVFLTEETIRNYLTEFKLPKELWGGFLENAAKTKKDFFALFAKEAANILSQVDLSKEARKFFEGQKMKINIEVSFDKKDLTVDKTEVSTENK